MFNRFYSTYRVSSLRGENGEKLYAATILKHLLIVDIICGHIKSYRP